MDFQRIYFNFKTAEEFRTRAVVPYEFQGLNKLTDGGSFFGDLVVFVGEAGLGKSTIANQMAGYLWRNQGYKTLIYSGEIEPALVIEAVGTQQDYRPYVDDKSCSIASVIDLEGIEYAAKEEHIKVFLIDNLTSLVEHSNCDLYSAQSNIMRGLKRIALQYECLIILVVHPNKTRESRNGGRLTMSSINGSSDIANWASLILALNRGEIPNERILEVLKNRKTGKLGEIRLMYDEQTLRSVEI